MYLKSLRIQGFKTFARKTDLPFSRGITAIVGPNGSGKSNLVDAVRWALGERNARGLRGNRMEDVIFAGGPGKSAVGMAEVSLVIDNADQRINVEFTELEVARRLFRSGDSEYLINGTRARLKDIDALLASTGLRQDGYAVVAQNDIDYVIQATPALRRELIEEAAGVRRLRDQRQEAVNRLTDAERDMRRARDLLNELSPRAEELRVQAAAAEEYQKLASHLKDLQGSLARDAWRKAMVQLRRAQTREHATRSKRETAATGLAEFEPMYSGHRAELAAAREARWNHQQALAEVRLRLAEAQHQVRIAEERKDAAIQAITAAQDELARLAQLERAGGQVVDELERAVVSTRTDLEQTTRVAESAAEEERGERETRAALDAQRTVLERQSQEIHRERLSIQAELRQLEGRLQFLREQRERAQAELQGWRLRHDLFVEEARQRGLHLEATERSLSDCSRAAATAEARVAEAGRAVTEAERVAASATAEAHAREAEAGALALLRDRDQPQSPLSQRSELGLRRLLEVITVGEDYRPAVEAVLAEWLAGWVAPEPGSAAQAVELLSGNGAIERETVLFNPPAANLTPLPPRAVSLKTFIRAPVWLDPLLSRLLDGVAIVDDLAAARQLLAEDPDLRVVTRAGELLTSYAYRGGRPRHAPLQVEAQLRDVEDARDRAEAAAQEARRSLAACVASHTALVEERESAVAQLDAARTEHARASAATAAASISSERDSEQGRQVQEQLARLEVLLAETAKLEADAGQRQVTIAAAEAALEGELPAVDQLIETTGVQLTACQQRRQDSELKAALARQRHDDLQRQLGRAREVWRAHGDDLAQRQAAAQELSGQPVAIDSERARWTTAAVELTRQLGELDSRQLPDAGSLTALEGRLHQDEQRNVALRVDLAHAGDAVAAAIVEVETAQSEVNRCALALRDDGQAVQEEEPSAEVDWQKTEREVSRLQRRLENMGAVNLLAPDEYAQLRDRCEGLGTQLTDLEAAAAQLMELRQRLEDEIDQRFRTVFQSVAVNFQEFFIELFEGGRATLRLMAEPGGDPLDDGVEILAQTPGKRLQPLTLLSGGERALTALSFLFALQAVSPSPFYVLDEVDAALDDANVVRFNRVLRRLAIEQQFLIVTHNHSTMSQAEVLYGVTLAEHGISRVVSVRLEHDATARPRIAERTA